MKIFVDGIIFGRQRFGGISKQWEEYLKRFPNYGVELKLLIPFGRVNQSLLRLLQQKEKYSIVQDYLYWPSRYFERVSVRSRILKWIYVDDSVDIFHSTYFSTVYSKKIKKVVTIHDMIPELFRNEYRSKWSSLVINTKKMVLENADKIIAVSHNTKKDILRFYPWIPEEKILVIYPATTYRNHASITFDSITEKYSVSAHPKEYFLFVGKRDGYKNFQLILGLLKNNKAYRDSLFLCVGGKSDERLLYLLRERGLFGNFIFLDFVEDNELVVLYQNALALVHPSKYEGFGLPIVEAMTNKCPVVCSNTSCLPEVAGDSAFYFDPSSTESLDEAITELLKCDKDEIIRKGLKNVARFSWERSTRILVDVYMSLSIDNRRWG